MDILFESTEEAENLYETTGTLEQKLDLSFDNFMEFYGKVIIPINRLWLINGDFDIKINL